ncbi:MAG TPA: alpha/beta fold hydrolase, partial [Micromonosporaceae bacterium]
MTARDTSIRVQERAVDVSTGPSGVDSVSLDTTFFLPPGADAAHPVPAVLLAHGFGQTKDDVATSARDLAGRGYAVLAWTAQGFGASGGQIHLVSPDWEVRDAGELVTWLASRPEVRQDGPGDPRVGVVGSSYGGALALLLAGTDRRVDAIVATATWHDLATALLPDRATGDPTRGVFKRQWAARLFGTGSVGSSSDSGASGGGTQCGRFAADVCAAYLDLAATGQVKASTLSLLRRSSPAAVASGIRAPTLLIQGTEDTLFPLAEADANQRAIAATGTPVRVAWFVGGHDGGPGPRADQDRVRRLSIQWLDHYLAGLGQRPADSFTFSRITSFTYARMTRVDTTAEGLVSAAFSVPAYPTGAPRYVTAPLHGPATQVASPPNSAPAAVSTVPGVSAALAGAISGGVAELPGQHADFESPPLAQAVDVVGAPRVDIRVAAPSAREAVLFVKIYDVDEQGRATLPAGLVAPVRVGGLGADITTAVPVTVTLPMLARRFERGHRVRVTIATTDQAYAGPAQPAVYVVATSGPVALPALPADPVVGPAALWWRALLAVLALLGAALIALTIRARRRRRRSDRPVAPEHAGTPLVIQGLRKEYADGFVAVSHVDITVDRDRVVGLLGPNGAGKTTTLRVLLGLTRPTAGTVLVFGHRVAPGAPILSRLGALVEGPGFLSHLSGLTNLELYWRTTGRP